MDADRTNEIIVGTNEEFILGFLLLKSEDGNITLSPSFSNHAHIGRVKQVAVCRNFLVTGSSDEFIKIFNLRNRREIGNLLSQEGTINCLQFHESGFLFSGSEDGTIGIFKLGKWGLEKELKGHLGAITGVAVHPSGKLALSISKDKRVITWDLMKGKRAHMAGLKKAGEHILWSPDGSHYLISSENILNIYSIAHGHIVQTIDFKENIYCFLYLTDKLLVIGGERKNLLLFDLESKTEVLEWEAHENRTKCLSVVDSSTDEFRHLATASSDGFIKIWMIDLSCVTSVPKLLGKVNTKSRIICMAFKPKENTSVQIKSVRSKQNSELTKLETERKRKEKEEPQRLDKKKRLRKNSNKLNKKESNKNNNEILKKQKKFAGKNINVTNNVENSEIEKSEKTADTKMKNNKPLFKGKKNKVKSSPQSKDSKKVQFKIQAKKRFNKNSDK